MMMMMMMMMNTNSKLCGFVHVDLFNSGLCVKSTAWFHRASVCTVHNISAAHLETDMIFIYSQTDPASIDLHTLQADRANQRHSAHLYS